MCPWWTLAGLGGAQRRRPVLFLRALQDHAAPRAVRLIRRGMEEEGGEAGDEGVCARQELEQVGAEGHRVRRSTSRLEQRPAVFADNAFMP